MKAEILLKDGPNYSGYIKKGGAVYRARIGLLEDGGYYLLFFINQISDATFSEAKQIFESRSTKRKKEREKEHDEKFLFLFEELIKRGYVVKEDEYNPRLHGRIGVVLDSEFNLLPGGIYSIPGKPEPKNAEELKLRLLGKF